MKKYVFSAIIVTILSIYFNVDAQISMVSDIDDSGIVRVVKVSELQAISKVSTKNSDTYLDCKDQKGCNADSFTVVDKTLYSFNTNSFPKEKSDFENDFHMDNLTSDNSCNLYSKQNLASEIAAAARFQVYTDKKSHLSGENCFKKNEADQPLEVYKNILRIVSDNTYLDCLNRNLCDKLSVQNQKICFAIDDLKNPYKIKNKLISCNNDPALDAKNKILININTSSSTSAGVASLIAGLAYPNGKVEDSSKLYGKLKRCYSFLNKKLGDTSNVIEVASAEQRFHEKNLSSQKIVKIPLTNLQEAHINNAIQGYINQDSKPNLGAYTPPSPTAVRKISNMFNRAITKADAAVKSGAAKTPQQMASVFDQEIQKDELLFQKNDRVVINGSSKLTKVDLPNSKAKTDISDSDAINGQNLQTGDSTKIASGAQKNKSNSQGNDNNTSEGGGSNVASRSPSSITKDSSEDTVMQSLAESIVVIKKSPAKQAQFNQRLDNLGIKVKIDSLTLGSKSPKKTFQYQNGKFVVVK